MPGGNFDIGAAYLMFGYDRLDSAYFPKHGQAFRASWQSENEALGASADANIVEASWVLARTFGRNSFVLSMEGGSALDDRVVSPQELFTLGGFMNLSGLPRDALIGTQMGIVRTIAYRRVSRGGTGLFEFPAYIGASLELGNVEIGDSDVANLPFLSKLDERSPGLDYRRGVRPVDLVQVDRLDSEPSKAGLRFSPNGFGSEPLANALLLPDQPAFGEDPRPIG